MADGGAQLLMPYSGCDVVLGRGTRQLKHVICWTFTVGRSWHRSVAAKSYIKTSSAECCRPRCTPWYWFRKRSALPIEKSGNAPTGAPLAGAAATLQALFFARIAVEDWLVEAASGATCVLEMSRLPQSGRAAR